ncbi:MAG: dihydroneopterin aldolase [Bacteroidales bacterium]|nr:dihydroneopterin aldolase [Bacteroidales bacterium]MDY2706063.1 dihydroneopterin aldolase [Alloprevotella sp.]
MLLFKPIQTSIQLHNLEFYAYHGLLPQERVVGGHYRVDVELSLTPPLRALTEDVIDDTVNYAEVYALIRQQMDQPVNLLEHLAHRITQGLYAQFPQIQAVKLSVTKVTPPISGIACEGASFCLQSIRE